MLHPAPLFRVHWPEPVTWIKTTISGTEKCNFSMCCTEDENESLLICSDAYKCRQALLFLYLQITLQSVTNNYCWEQRILQSKYLFYSYVNKEHHPSSSQIFLISKYMFNKTFYKVLKVLEKVNQVTIILYKFTHNKNNLSRIWNKMLQTG